jgi:hypothetical protein
MYEKNFFYSFEQNHFLFVIRVEKMQKRLYLCNPKNAAGINFIV